MKSLIRFSFFNARRVPPAAVASSARGLHRAAFSLIELMSAMAIITLLTGLAVPAVKGVTGGNTVTASASKLSGLLTLARSEAIAQHTIVRFVVATDWSGKEDANLRRMSLWAWRADSGRFEQLTQWEELPVGMIVERELPDYIRTAQYATDDASTVRGSSVFGDELAGVAEFAAGTVQEPISSRFIEFLPSGSARIPNSAERRAIFVAAQGFVNPGGGLTYTSQANGQPNNWAQVNVDTLTGRVHVYRP